MRIPNSTAGKNAGKIGLDPVGEIDVRDGDPHHAVAVGTTAKESILNMVSENLLRERFATAYNDGCCERLSVAPETTISLMFKAVGTCEFVVERDGFNVRRFPAGKGAFGIAYAAAREVAVAEKPKTRVTRTRRATQLCIFGKAFDKPIYGRKAV